MTEPRIERLSGIATIADRYDGVILDLWGVIHDGEKLYPGVEEALANLRAAGKVICMLSNAPRRPAGVIAKLEGMGLPRDAYDHILTSGEASHDAMLHREDDWHAALGPRLFHLGPERDRDVFEDLPYEVVATPEEADFVVNTGIDDFSETLADYEDILRRCADARLPMLCANPDLVVMVGPIMAICAGTLAARYQEMGGDVRQHGKPLAPVYDRCLKLMGLSDKRRILAVGDSLRTDIAGANAAGIDCALAACGIHAEELLAGWGETGDMDRLYAAVKAIGPQPTYVIPSLRW